MHRLRDKMSIPVLTYHSIGEGYGPTSMPEKLFRKQLVALSDLGYRGVTLSEYLCWIRGGASLSSRSVLITFDDAFDDFAKLAAPELLKHDFGACVFVPTGRLGLSEDWIGSSYPAKPIISSVTALSLVNAGFELGSHSVTHKDLTQLDDRELEYELTQSLDTLASLTGKPVSAFAPPYGASSQRVRTQVAKYYDCSFGVSLGCSELDGDLFEIPRIEMHYFRDDLRFRAFLNGSRTYLGIRQLGRNLRSLLPKNGVRSMRGPTL